jgi:hypothetical protein
MADAKKKKPDHVSELDGYKVEWRFRRSEYEADVYNAKGELVSELEYPKVPGNNRLYLDDFAKEAVSIAKRKEEEKQADAVH